MLVKLTSDCTKIVNADLASLCHTSDQPQPPAPLEAKLGDFVCVRMCMSMRQRERKKERERERKKKHVGLRVGIVVF